MFSVLLHSDHKLLNVFSGILIWKTSGVFWTLKKKVIWCGPKETLRLAFYQSIKPFACFHGCYEHSDCWLSEFCESERWSFFCCSLWSLSFWLLIVLLLQHAAGHWFQFSGAGHFLTFLWCVHFVSRCWSWDFFFLHSFIMLCMI